MATKIETRKATMRHTATLEAMHANAADRAIAGVNLRSGIETLMSFDHFTAEELQAELRKLVIQHYDEIDKASAKFQSHGYTIDHTKFVDEA